jgi:hypothetical protein
VKLEAKLMRLEQRGELAICREESFRFAAGQEKAWSGFRIRGTDQENRDQEIEIRIVVTAGLVFGGPENRGAVARRFPGA